MQPIVAATEHRVGFIRMILKEPGAEEGHRRALALYRGLIAATPDDFDLRERLARTYSDLICVLQTTGQPDAALDCFPPLLALRRGLAIDFPAEKLNRTSLVYFQADYSRLLKDAGRPREAAEVRRQLQDSYLMTLASEPNDPVPLNNLAWLLGEPSGCHRLTTRPGRSRLAKEAVALAPAVGDYWNTLGVAHYRPGDAKAAAAALEESMRLRSGGDAYDWLFLAMVRRRLGDPADARRWYDRSLAWIETNAPHNRELLRFRAEAARLLEPERPPAPKLAGDRRLSK